MAPPSSESKGELVDFLIVSKHNVVLLYRKSWFDHSIPILVHHDVLKTHNAPKDEHKGTLMDVYKTDFSSQVKNMVRGLHDQDKTLLYQIWVRKKPDADGTVHLEFDYKSPKKTPDGTETEKEENTVKLTEQAIRDMKALNGM